ncbi:hypothetical protein IQ273_03035 [Nodosilinea sp. LEGE 07298]|uniref:hypothetical protein n=1 Tax=Nodosilinea sp. LEGE 07298 TaxID=2777970 RepID=UPI0018821843|nr:hypothetical protein [Nodosilinea sp. LEGE 07298]MBE9108393.1 hypothetical protein [Nodosilinea sp. LEGE 07298]
MALKFNKQSLQDFHERLSSVDASWQDDFTLKEMVKKSLKPISKARRYKVSWEKIALMLQEVTGGELDISAASVRQYYFELTDKSAKKEKTNKPKPKSFKQDRKTPETRVNQSGEQSDHSGIDSSITADKSNDSPQNQPSEEQPEADEMSQEISTNDAVNPSDNLPASPQKELGTSQRKPPSEIQSSFNLRRP